MLGPFRPPVQCCGPPPPQNDASYTCGAPGARPHEPRRLHTMESRPVTLPGINIQVPWAEAILSGQKVIETRFYPLPGKWVGQPLAVIETPGRARGFKSHIAGF